MAQTQTPNVDQQAIALIQSSGILNPNATLDKIIEISGKISELQGAGPVSRITAIFIHPGFIYSFAD
jgi:hypothetical protein